MDNEKELKEMVKQKYGQIAAESAESSCCETNAQAWSKQTKCCCGSASDVNYTVMSDDYKELNGYVAEADLSLGCGLPTEFAGIKDGDTVVDLGSGAGNDVFIARSLTGKNGKVIGIDMTPEMIEKALKNKAKTGYENIDFLFGEIENIPLEDGTADVVVSNCVLNLVPDKTKAFTEMFRILKTGGHFCISDIVLKGELPEGLVQSAEMYAGCVSGALQQKDYLACISNAGFGNIEIKKTKTIVLPEDILKNFLNKEDAIKFMNSGNGIFSITVVGYKN